MLPLIIFVAPTVLNFHPARPSIELHDAPSIHLVHGLLDNATVASLLARLPKDESAWLPCIGQKQEFATKKCAHIPAAQALLERVSETWSIDTRLLAARGLPVIRYIPGGGPVGIHSDIDDHGVVPNATIVIYLTEAEVDDGHTFFPELDVSVRPRAGSALSFANVDAHGTPDPRARHGVAPVAKHASRDRVVVQIPVRTVRPDVHGGYRWEAYPEHVSGIKHGAHMGVMVLVLLGFGAYSWWQSTYGDAGMLKAAGKVALRVVGEVSSVDGRL